MRKPQAFQEPKQQRTREQLAQILLVADRLFTERGYEGTRLAEIAAAVPCSMSTIYDRFASKEELLRYMHRQGTEEAIAMIDQIEPPDVSGMDLRVVLPTALQTGLSLIERFGGRRRAVAERVHADPVLLSLESELREALVEAGRRFLLTYRHQFHHPDPDLAASQAMHLMMVLTEERHSPLPVPRPTSTRRRRLHSRGLSHGHRLPRHQRNGLNDRATSFKPNQWNRRK